MIISSHKSQDLKLYAIQVSGISCAGCAGSITKLLNDNLVEKQLKITVNIMQEKIYLTVGEDNTAKQAMEILKKTKFIPVGEPILLSGSEQNHRKIAFLISTQREQKEIDKTIRTTTGVLWLEVRVQQDKLKVSVTYDCNIIKGRQLGDIIQSIDNGYLIINQRIQSLSEDKRINKSEHNIRLTFALFAYFLLINMVLPILPFTQSYYQQCMNYPRNFGIYSFGVIFNIALTLYVMKKYAFGYIQRAYKSYSQIKATNMETLISLGCISAFSLFLFFFGRYTIQTLNSEIQHIHMAIMDINDALASASIIVLTVTIGKHFESKAKRQIQAITDNLFPESVIFQNMKVQFAEIRNRMLNISKQKQYDVSLIEKGDVLSIKQGRVLLDLIIISGTVKAVQSARTGSDKIVGLTKGDRLESGAIVKEVQNCLAEVENVLEKSLLIQMFTHIKFAQNQESNQQSGVQAICKTISDVFVKVVISLSIITMVVWSTLIFFEVAQIPKCAVCWVFERGIGVLVASCPCALGLAVPSVIAIVLNLATKSGILIKNIDTFEKMKKVKRISFDKTGTLFNRLKTIEQFNIVSKSFTKQQMWQMLAILQKQIRHPLAEVIYKEAFQRSQINGTNYGFILCEKPKLQADGLVGRLLKKQGKQYVDVLVGNKQILKRHGIQIPELSRNSQSIQSGSTTLFLAANQQVLMVLILNTHSNLRPEAIQVIRKIEQENIEVHILSGDADQSVKKLGKSLSIKNQCLHAEYDAFDKQNWIKDYQKDHLEEIIMVGDGLNDIPCLQQAGIGISINAKSQLNINAADIVILSENLYKILALIRFLKKGNLFIKINLFWAFAYNIMIMPIVAGVFFHWGVFVSPIWSCVAMSCSSLIVVSFSHLLMCIQYDDSLVQQVDQFKIRYENRLENSTREILPNLTMQDEISQS